MAFFQKILLSFCATYCRLSGASVIAPALRMSRAVVSFSSRPARDFKMRSGAESVTATSCHSTIWFIVIIGDCGYYRLLLLTAYCSQSLSWQSDTQISSWLCHRSASRAWSCGRDSQTEARLHGGSSSWAPSVGNRIWKERQSYPCGGAKLPWQPQFRYHAPLCVIPPWENQPRSPGASCRAKLGKSVWQMCWVCARFGISRLCLTKKLSAAYSAI